MLGVLRTLWRWRRPIIITTLATALIAVIVSLLLPVRYTGYTAFVAISPEQLSIENTFGTGMGRVQFYGTGDDIDRLLSIAESNELVNFMVDSFDLYTVYDIDPNTLKGPVRVSEEFLSNYEVSRNPRDVIELTVEDSDPQRAAAMATAARRRTDDLNLQLIRSTQRRSASGLENDVRESEARLNEINRQLAALRETSGVYNTETQSEALGVASSSLDRQLATTEARLAAFRQTGRRDSIQQLGVDLLGLRSMRTSLDTALTKLNASIGQIENLEEERLQANEALSESRIRLKQYRSILEGEGRTLEVIEEAAVPLVKSSPVRWLIVVVTTLVVFVFSVVGVLLLDSGRRYDWNGITR